jgi:hypothetical protein
VVSSPVAVESSAPDPAREGGRDGFGEAVPGAKVPFGALQIHSIISSNLETKKNSVE